MGEIKSTLDLVMERTKHFSLSQEEKRKMQSEEISKKINRLLNKLYEGSLSLEQGDREIRKLKTDLGSMVGQILMDQVIDDIEITRDNSIRVKILKDLLQCEASSIENMINRYHQRITQLRQLVDSNALAKLEQEGIFGLAVVSNPDADDSFFKESNEIRSQFDSELNLEKHKLKQISLNET